MVGETRLAQKPLGSPLRKRLFPYWPFTTPFFLGSYLFYSWGFSMEWFKLRAWLAPIFLLSLLAMPKDLGAQVVELLWPQGAPGALGTADVDKPSLTLFPATGTKVNGAAVVICPGGGYGALAMDHEGKQVALWMNTLGVSAFVLKYRLGPTYHHPIELNDAQRALRWVRANAKRFKIDVNRVGIVGFSAGGHEAASASTHYDSGSVAAADTIDRFQCRPDFSILCYPVITMDASFTHAGSRTNLLGNSPSQALVDLMSNEKQVNAKTPRAFLFHSKDDGVVPIKNSQSYYDALVKAGIATEFKIFETGGHGYGMADGKGGAPTDPVLAVWPGLVAKWMTSQGFLQMPVAIVSGHKKAPSLITKQLSFSKRFVWTPGVGPSLINATGRQMGLKPDREPN
jgi:acetyl esterase/lipase